MKSKLNSCVFFTWKDTWKDHVCFQSCIVQSCFIPIEITTLKDLFVLRQKINSKLQFPKICSYAWLQKTLQRIAGKLTILYFVYFFTLCGLCCFFFSFFLYWYDNKVSRKKKRSQKQHLIIIRHICNIKGYWIGHHRTTNHR